jgi:hypothetical protein
MLFKNNGNGTFTNVASSAGLTDNLIAWGLNCADYDNNGFEDIFVYCSGQSTTCKLYMNNGNETFTEVISASGIGASLVQLQAAWGDYNNDGWMDLYTSGSASNENHLFRNNGEAGKHWLQINLVGDSTNRSAVNTQVDCIAGSLKMMREVNTAAGYRSQNQLRVHFGLNTETQADTIIVRWPSGWTDVFTNVAADQIITITEFETIPVELTSFTASVSDNNVELNWTTATETNNRGFEIERYALSAKHKGWEKIGFVAGFGTTTEPKSYSFVDENISSGTYSYRLKQIDYDGSYEFSEVIEVEVAQIYKFSLEQNYPNPFNPSTSIQYAVDSRQFVTLIVFDILGREVATLVNEEKPAGKYEVEFNAAELPSGVSAKGGYASGVYFYQLKAGNYIETKKMVLMK